MREPFSSAVRNATIPTLPSPPCSHVSMLGMFTFYIIHIYIYVCSNIVPMNFDESMNFCSGRCL